VPNVNWNSDNDKLKVNWYNTDNRNDNLRPREVSGKAPLRSFSLSKIFYPAVYHFRDFLKLLFDVEIYIRLDDVYFILGPYKTFQNFGFNSCGGK